MLARTLSSQLPERAGSPVLLQGWVHRIRNFGGLRFLVLRDRGGLAQIVVPKSLDLGEINCEWVVAGARHRAAEPRAPRGVRGPRRARRDHFAGGASADRCLHAGHAEQSRLETLLDHRAISLRMPEVLDVFRVQSEIVQAFRKRFSPKDSPRS